MINTATVNTFVKHTNAFQVEEALLLFAPDAVIDDESVGAKFRGSGGVRRYLERYFVGYHTKTEVVSIEDVGQAVLVRVDFNGDFGHETGRLDFTFDAQGRIALLQADLD